MSAEVKPLSAAALAKAAKGGDVFAMAGAYLRTWIMENTHTLVHWRGDLYRFERRTWQRYAAADLRAAIYRWLSAAGLPARRRLVDDVLDAVRAVVHLNERTMPPIWRLHKADDPDPGDLLVLPNGLLRLEDRVLLPATPRLFATHALGVPFEEDPKPPARFMAFIDELFGDDAESKRALRQWFGLFLIPDLRYQKGLLLIGPPRAGKGIIAQLVSSILGEHNFVAPALAQFGLNFGLAPLIDRLVACVSDARLSGRPDAGLIAENLLRITAGDSVTVDRKHAVAWTGVLPTRLMLLTNELPRIADASGALSSRFIVIRLTRSFLGAEDTNLLSALRAELPGILHWALDGLADLRQTGRLIEPSSAEGARQELRDLSSPVMAFVRERLVTEPGVEVPVAHVWDAWSGWCQERGRDRKGDQQGLGKQIRAVLPWVEESRPRTPEGKRIRCYLGLRLRAETDDV